MSMELMPGREDVGYVDTDHADVCERCENWINAPARCKGCDHEEEGMAIAKEYKAMQEGTK